MSMSISIRNLNPERKVGYLNKETLPNYFEKINVIMTLGRGLGP